MQITYRYRVKDKHAARLKALAAAVNFVWNDCNKVQTKAAKAGRKWLDDGGLARLTAGVAKEGLDLYSQTVQQICKRYDVSRQQHRKSWLNSRRSKGARRSLILFNQQAVEFRDGAFVFRGAAYRAFCIEGFCRRAPSSDVGCFLRDSRGRSPINVPIEVTEGAQAENARVGIDLGTKTLARLCCGDKIAMPAFDRTHEMKLASSQRAPKSRRANDCGAVPDRDGNAARTILRAGVRTLVKGARARKQEPRSPAVRQGSSHCSSP